MSDRPWYEEAFDRLYLDVYAHRDETDAARAIDFLEARGALCRQGRVLDLACGNGRHSEALAEWGMRVTGIDLSADLLREFQRRAGQRIAQVRGDMRALPFAPRFDMVASLFTSFGYFDDDAENWLVIREVCRVLRPGGVFLLDFLNAPRVERTLVPESIRTLDGEHTAEERRWIDRERRRVVKRIRLLRGGETVRLWEESVRLLTRGEIERAMREACFEGIEAFGGFDASPHTERSDRLILLARKAKIG